MGLENCFFISRATSPVIAMYPSGLMSALYPVLNGVGGAASDSESRDKSTLLPIPCYLTIYEFL